MTSAPKIPMSWEEAFKPLDDIPAGQPEPEARADVAEFANVEKEDQADNDEKKEQEPAAKAERLDPGDLPSGEMFGKLIEDFGAAAVAAAPLAGAGACGNQPANSAVMKDGVNARDTGFATSLQGLIDEDKDIDSRSAVSQRMMRELTSAQKSDLKGMTHTDKKAFRRGWAEKRLGDFKEEKTFVHDWRKIDVTKGTYMSASKVFLEEGGTAADIEPCKRILQKCASMGPPFVLYNQFSERHDYLYLRKEFAEEMTKSWTLYQKWSDAATAPAPAAAASAGVAPRVQASVGASAAAEVATEAGLETPLAGANAGKRKRAAGEPTPEKPEKDDKKREGQKAITEATKVKAKYFKIMKATEEMFDAVKGDKAWEWAKSATTTARVQQVYDQITACQNLFSKAFHTHELADVKKQFPAELLVKNCSEYVNSFAKRLDELSKETCKLNKMHLIHTGQ